MIRFPIVLSAPSGVGKTTIARRLLALRPDVGYSISATTRQPRGDERQGVDYHFLTDEEFLAREARGEFAESAVVHGRRYGTLRSEVGRLLREGRHVLMDIDVQGAAMFSRAFPETVLVFVLPPSVEALLDRLRARGTESDAQLAERLRNAHAEFQEAGRYHHVVVNDDVERAVAEVSGVIDAESRNRARIRAIDAQVSGLVAELEARIALFKA
ncbi:MAG: guanylate kinase [Gemmatimonadaceae bacterium]|nr:guanylate kinase [Gemmatimonadaceae bacterium]